MLGQLSQNNYYLHLNQTENYQFIKYDKEFKIQKLTKNGGYEQIKIKMNSQGAALCQDGKMEKFIQYSNCKFDFEENLVFTYYHLRKWNYLQDNNKNELSAINKLIFQYTKNSEIKYQMSKQENTIQYCIKQMMEQIESNCYIHLIQINDVENSNFHSFIDIYKTTQMNTDVKSIENDDFTINLGIFRESILETLSILPREQFRKKLIIFNSQFKYTASCKIEDQIEEFDRLLQPLDNILASEEDIRKYSQLLS